MTTFIDTSVLISGPEASDQDPVVVVVRSAQSMLREGLGEEASAKFESAFAEKYENQDWSSIFDLMLGNASVIFKKLAAASDDTDLLLKISKTAEGYFEVVLSTLSKLDSVEAVIDRIDAFISAMSHSASSPITVEHLKLKLLITLFNTISPRTHLRLAIVKGLCRFASGNEKMCSMVYPLVNGVDRWIEDNDWDIEDEEKQLVFNAVRSVALSPADAIRFLRLETQISSGEPRKRLAEELVIKTAGSEGIYDFDVLNEFRSDISETSKKFLAAVSSDKFSDMEAFLNSNKSWLTSSEHLLLEKMRALGLTGMLKDTNQVSIKVVGETLKTDDAVGVVVRALRAGLIRGSIDEVHGVVRIEAVANKSVSDIDRIVKKLGA